MQSWQSWLLISGCRQGRYNGVKVQIQAMNGRGWGKRSREQGEPTVSPNARRSGTWVKAPSWKDAWLGRSTSSVLISPPCSLLPAPLPLVAAHFGVLARRIVILVCLLLLVSCQGKSQPTANQAQVKVARVVSGQSLEVLGMAEQPNLISQVRLIGIEAPDLRQRPWGDDAKDELEKMIGGAEQIVTLEFDIEGKDKIGRTVAYVWKDKLLLNEEIVKKGYALFVPRSPNHKYDQRLERAQQWARIMGQGIWQPEKPMRLTPAEFRRQYR